MSDTTPKPPTVPEPTWLQRIITTILPQFIAYSRKGLVWFSGLSVVGLAELAKGICSSCSPDEIQKWTNRMMFIQGLVVLVAKFWTDQITKEDQALKTGLPPPVVVVPPPAQPPIQGLPPPPLRGEGD